MSKLQELAELEARAKQLRSEVTPEVTGRMSAIVTLKPSDVPKSWLKELQRLQSIHRNVVLAGGALRDLDLGLPVKDLDFFIAVGDESEAHHLNKLMGGEEVKDWDALDEDDRRCYPDSMREVIHVADLGKKVGGKTAQLIFINWGIWNIMDRFDYGLCQIMFDGERIKTTKAYEKDKKEKTLTVVRADSAAALASSVKRYRRWADKFPDHDWILGVDVTGSESVGPFVFD